MFDIVIINVIGMNYYLVFHLLYFVLIEVFTLDVTYSYYSKLV